MPVRDKAVSTAFTTIMGDTSYHFYNNPRNPTATIDGVEMPHEVFRARYMDPIERVYERVVDSIDWNRVMIEAQARHLTLHEGEDKHSFPFTEDICPECLCESLMADDTHNDWKANPKAPRYHK